MAHLLAERPIGWLEGELDDTLLELHAETEDLVTALNITVI